MKKPRKELKSRNSLSLRGFKWCPSRTRTWDLRIKNPEHASRNVLQEREIGATPDSVFPPTFPRGAVALAQALLERAEHTADPLPLIAAARALLAENTDRQDDGGRADGLGA